MAVTLTPFYSEPIHSLDWRISLALAAAWLLVVLGSYYAWERWK